MRVESGVTDAAQLFKVLGSESRLRLLLLLGERPRTVGALEEATEMSQPLVSQHLRTLRQIGLVTATRRGKEVTYHLADVHVTHVIADALTHVQESAADDGRLGPSRKESA
jgi:DNA-binding transcriptional ArsR family regulator